MPHSFYSLILAGGIGARLWPRSRTRHPKQFIDLMGDLTMLQEARERLSPLAGPEYTLVATGERYAETVLKQLPELPAENVIREPVGRGTAAAIGLAALHIQKRDPEALMAVLTADHLIKKVDVFRQVLKAALTVADEGWLVTLGIQPSYPETGYGYIERGDFLGSVGEFEGFRVRRFVEKPDFETAQKYLQNGSYDWNSGMFVWQVERILEEMELHLPVLYGGLARIGEALGTEAYPERLAEVFPSLPNVTIDYGIMEKAEKVAVLPVDLGWNDVGSWSAVFDVLPKDGFNNAVVGRHLSPDTNDSLVYSPNRLVATIGLNNLVIIDTEDVLLVCPRDRAQDVRKLVEMLKTNGESQYLHGAGRIEALMAVQVQELLREADSLERVLVSLLLHSGLWPSHVAALNSKAVDLILGWVDTPDGRRPLPDATRQYLYDWLREQDSLKYDFSKIWKSSDHIKAVLAALGERAGVPLTVDILFETLARALYGSSEEGQAVRRVLGEEASLVRVPLHALFPFSLADFSGNEDNALGERARRVLNRAGDWMSRV